MDFAVRYYSRGGNTAKLANAVGEVLGVEAKTVAENLEEETDILFLGNSLYAGKPNKVIVNFIKENAEKIGTIVNFGSSASGNSTIKRVKKLCAELNIKVFDEEFICPGSFLFMHKGRPNDTDIENIKWVEW